MKVKLTEDGLEYLKGFCSHTGEDLVREFSATPYREAPEFVIKVSEFNCNLGSHLLRRGQYEVSVPGD